MEKKEEKKESSLNETIAKIDDSVEESENPALSNDIEDLKQEDGKQEIQPVKESEVQEKKDGEVSESIEFSYYEDSVLEHQKEPLFGREDYVDKNNNPVLFGNPFLYSAKKASEDNISSIEDFAVKYKTSNVYLGSIVHNDKIDSKMKSKLVKKSFKAWKKNFKTTCVDAIGNVSKSVETMEITPVKTVRGKFKATLIIFLIIEIAFMLFFLNSKINLIPVEMLVNASSNLFDQFNNSFIHKLVIAFPIVMLLAMMILGIIYKIQSRKFRKLKKKAVKFSTKSSKEIKKDFKKVYPKTYKYYLTNVKKLDNEMFEPMKIDEVACNNCDVTEIEELVVDAVSVAAVQTKRCNRTKWLLRLFLTLFVVTIIGSIVLFVLAML